MAFILIKKNYKHQLNSHKRPQRSRTIALPAMLLSLTLAANHVQAEQPIAIEQPILNDTQEIDSTHSQTELANSNIIAFTDNDTDKISANEQNKLLAKLKQNPWAFLHPFKANYTVYSNGKKLGSATRELSIEDGYWKIRRHGKLSKWLLNLKSDEHSKFKIEEQKLMVESFKTSSKVSFKDKKTINQHYDWQNKIETGNKGKTKWQLELNQETFDRMSHIIQLRADILTNQKEFNYLVSYKGKRELYTYHRTTVEQIKTPFGLLDAVKMDRDDGDESNSIWFSPELNYFPVKISKFEQDEAEIVLILNKLDYTESSND
jgi:hypothetical protein